MHAAHNNRQCQRFQYGARSTTSTVLLLANRQLTFRLTFLAGRGGELLLCLLAFGLTYVGASK